MPAFAGLCEPVRFGEEGPDRPSGHVVITISLREASWDGEHEWVWLLQPAAGDSSGPAGLQWGCLRQVQQDTVSREECDPEILQAPKHRPTSSPPLPCLLAGRSVRPT